MTRLELDTIRPSDMRGLARLHCQAFPLLFLSTLGEPFLREFYRSFLRDSTAVAVVLRDGRREPRGCVVGTTEPWGFLGRLVRRRWVGGLASARVVASRPSAVPRLLRALRYLGPAQLYLP